MEIKKVVVIGSGTMGSGIAAHLCNANVPVTLLDLTTDISTKARERIHKSRPPLLIDKSKIDNIKVGNINDDFNSVFASLNGDGKRKAEDGDSADVSKRHKAEGQGEREELRLYETMPSQMLNAYGMAAFAQMDHKKVMEDLTSRRRLGRSI